MTKYVILALLALLTTGCAATYSEVQEGEPHATITFQRNMEGVKAVNNEPYQGYTLLDSPSCGNTENIATFSFDSQYIKTARFSAGKKLHFAMHSVPNQNIYGPWCWSYLGFDAENERDYVVMHNNCTPVVYDRTDGVWERVEAIDVIDGFECPRNKS